MDGDVRLKQYVGLWARHCLAHSSLLHPQLDGVIKV